jgi:hypothetical protein
MLIKWNVGDRVGRKTVFEDNTWNKCGDVCLKDSPLKYGTVVIVGHTRPDDVVVRFDDGEQKTFLDHGIHLSNEYFQGTQKKIHTIDTSTMYSDNVLIGAIWQFLFDYTRKIDPSCLDNMWNLLCDHKILKIYFISFGNIPPMENSFVRNYTPAKGWEDPENQDTSKRHLYWCCEGFKGMTSTNERYMWGKENQLHLVWTPQDNKVEIYEVIE